MRGIVTAGRVIGLLALVTVTGAGCSTASGTAAGTKAPASAAAAAKVPVSAAAGKPCLLVSLSEATPILGHGAITSSLPGTSGLPAACSFGEAQSPLTIIQVHIIPTSFAVSSSFYISGPAPAGTVGHGAVCGASTKLPGGSALVGHVDSETSLLVDGLKTSCTTLEQFATIAYSHLQI
jgi:hypothetical protein